MTAYIENDAYWHIKHDQKNRIDNILGEHLLAVWLRSPYGLKVLTSSLYCDLWENHGGMVKRLDQPEGNLEQRIEQWLRQKLEAGQRIEKMSSRDYLLAMEQEKEQESER